MFRKMRRSQQELPEDQCVTILKAEPRGVLSVIGDNGYPYGFPMDFIYLDGKVYFHCAKEGKKMDSIQKDDRVSFCVMDRGFPTEGHWALNISSVILFGRIAPVHEPERALEIVRALGNKYYPDADSVEKEIEKSFSHVVIWELSIDHMTGKLVNES